MIQPVPFQRVRAPLLAVGLAALAALAALGAPKLNQPTAASVPPAPVTVEIAPALAQRPFEVQALTDTSPCSANAYVTGDLVGDASPAAVYAALCPGR